MDFHAKNVLNEHLIRNCISDLTMNVKDFRNKMLDVFVSLNRESFLLSFKPSMTGIFNY